MTSTPEIRVLSSPQEIFHAGAKEFARRTKQAVTTSGRFTVALSGGSTPKGLYSLLATEFRSSLPWQQMFFFWGDERHVAPTDPDSNYRMTSEAMLSKVPVPPENIFRVPAENPDAEEAAAEYDRSLTKFFAAKPREFPRFDLILLGLGPDGHTASLFPETKALEEKNRIVVANWVPKFNTHRITFTLPVLNNAKCVMFLVAGADKSSPLREVLEGSAPGRQFPAKLVRPANGELIWLVDRQAAASLSEDLQHSSPGKIGN